MKQKLLSAIAAVIVATPAALLTGCLGSGGGGDGTSETATQTALAMSTTKGTLDDGTAWRIDYPDNWNGILLVNLDYAGRDPMNDTDNNNITSHKLLELGYATSGTTRIVSGWSLHKAAANAVKVLDCSLEEARRGLLTTPRPNSPGHIPPVI